MRKTPISGRAPLWWLLSGFLLAVVWIYASSQSGFLSLPQRVMELESQKAELLGKKEALLQKLYDAKHADGVLKTENAALAEALVPAANLAGRISFIGPGLVITLEDAPREKLDPGNPAELGIVHDVDVLQVINALRAGGAEAISVNGVRVLGTTRIRCGGPIINVQTTRLTPPFEIRAVGDRDKLKAMLEADNLLRLITAFGVAAKVEEREQVFVPAAQDAQKLRFARQANLKGP